MSAEPLVVRRETLSSGLQIILQPAPAGASTFSASYIGPAGWAYDPAGGAATSMAVNELLSSGAGVRNRLQFAEALDRAGATFSVDCDPESAQATLWGPAQGHARLLPLLSDAVLRPRFPSPELARVRRELHERQLRERTQPERRAESELFRTIFPRGHPYREFGLGSPASLATLNVAGLRRFHRAHYVAAGASVVLTAPKPERSLPVLRRLFRDLASTPPPSAPRVPRPPAASPAPHRIPMPGRSQVDIRIGGPSPPRGDPEFPALFLANEVLGGRSLLCRLFQHLREEHGLAYGASSRLEAMRWGGYWVAEAGTAPANAERALSLMQAELERIRHEPVAAAELDRIRESTIGELTLELETTAGAHQLALDVAYHALPEGFWRDWPGQLRALGPQELRRAADRGLGGLGVASVLAGPPVPRAA